MFSKQLILLSLLRGQVGDSTAVVDHLSAPIRSLMQDAVGSCHDDIVGYFGISRNEF